MSKYYKKPIVFNGECGHPVCGEEVWSKDSRRVFCDKHRHWDGKLFLNPEEGVEEKNGVVEVVEEPTLVESIVEVWGDEGKE